MVDISNFIKFNKLLFSAILPLLYVALSPKQSTADIYRFVTIDGVESFTDAPLSKDAQIIMKDKHPPTKRSIKKTVKQKTKDISLEEVVAKAVQSIQPDYMNEAPLSTNRFEIRLPPVGGTITSSVGMRIDPIDGRWRMHNGIDIAIPQGTAVKPAADGTVIYSATRSGYGNTILMEHDNGVVTLYAHNSKLLVSVGERVDSNTTIALSGNTGRSTGPHLHFEAWQAGTNITSAFMPGSGEKLPTLLASAFPAKSTFRKQILTDGTILFTNLP